MSFPQSVFIFIQFLTKNPPRIGVHMPFSPVRNVAAVTRLCDSQTFLVIYFFPFPVVLQLRIS